ncbi:MAG: histone deacetylase [Methylocystaceae bacterium]
MADKPTGIVFFPAFDWAISPTHPEREERLLYTRDQLFEEGIMDHPSVLEMQPRLATAHDIARTHFCVPGVANIASQAHLIAAGGALTIGDAFIKERIKNGFALVRPPGHHAMRVSHGNRGFCNINNEAILVEYLRSKYQIHRIAIVDTDVHHGDGTQDIFWHDPDVLFISFHQDGRTLYPGTGFMEEMGGPLALGTTINVPLPPGTTDEGILYVLDDLVMPLLKAFKPQVVINSAGQDNHFSDPLANMCFSARGYALLNQRLAPDIAVLEGGYSVETALPYINTGIIMAMAGLDFSALREPDYEADKFRESPQRMAQLRAIVEHQGEIFDQRNKLVEDARKKYGTSWQRRRNVYYDTDHIQEQQQENLRLCPDCSGLLTINSQARGYDALCLVLPYGACTSCRQIAEETYQTARSHHHDYVYYQDKPRDHFQVYDCKRQEGNTI